jgi:hypothetical protein
MVCDEKFDLVCEQKMVFVVENQKQRKISRIAAIDLYSKVFHEQISNAALLTQ